MPQSMGSQRDRHDSVNEQQQIDKQKDKGNDSGIYRHLCDKTDQASEKRQYSLINKWI